MANGRENLEVIRTSEEARERGRKGGIASGIARRRKKAMKDRLELLLLLQTKHGTLADLEGLETLDDLKGLPITIEDSILLAQIQKALKGDTRAAEYVRDTSGNKPSEHIEVTRDLDETAQELDEYINEYKKRNDGTDPK